MIKFTLFNVLFFCGIQPTLAEQVLHSQCFREKIASVERVKYEIAQQLSARYTYDQDLTNNPDPSNGRTNPSDERPTNSNHELLEYDVSVEPCERGSWENYLPGEGPLGARVKIVVPTIVDVPRSLFRGE